MNKDLAAQYSNQVTSVAFLRLKGGEMAQRYGPEVTHSNGVCYVDMIKPIYYIDYIQFPSSTNTNTVTWSKTYGIDLSRFKLSVISANSLINANNMTGPQITISSATVTIVTRQFGGVFFIAQEVI